MRRHFLGPDPLLEPRTFRRDDDDGDRLETGDVNNLPSTVGGGGFHADGKLPRFREDDFKPLSAARADRRRRRSSTGRSTTTRWSRTTPRPSASSASPARPDANPFASWRADPYPMPPGADMFCAVLTTEAATAARLPPVPRADRREQRASTTAGPRATTAGSAGTSAARSTPRATRSRRCATRCAPATARSAPSRSSPTCCSTAPGAGRAACATSTPTLDAHEVSARHVVLAGGAFETPRLLLRTGLGNPDVVGRYLLYHFQTYVLGMFPYRLHGHRGRSVTHLMDDPIVPDDARAGRGPRGGAPLLPRRDRRARRGRAPDPGGHPPPPRRAALRSSMLRVADARPHGRVHDAGRGPAAGRPTASTSTRTSATCYGLPGRAGHVRRRTATRSCAPSTGRRGSRRSCATPAPSTTFWTTSPPLPGSMADRPGGRTPISRHIMGGARMGDDPRDERRSTGGSDCTTSRTCSAPTRRCSRRRPATARRSRSSRSRSAPARALAGLDPLHSTRPT